MPCKVLLYMADGTVHSTLKFSRGTGKRKYESANSAECLSWPEIRNTKCVHGIVLLARLLHINKLK